MNPITVVTALGPGSHPWLKHTAQSVYSASEILGYPVHWVLAGGKDVNFSTVCEDLEIDRTHDIGTTAGYVPMVIEIPSVSSAATGRNIASMSAPDNPRGWIVNLDSDDLLFHDRFLLLPEDDDFQVTAAEDMIYDDKNDTWSIDDVDYPRPHGPLTTGWFHESLANGNGALNVHMATLSIRKRVLQEIGGYPSVPFCEDTILAHRLDREGYAGSVTDKTGYFYRRHPDQITKIDYDAESLISYWTQ